jgi:hypothetical protein
MRGAGGSRRCAARRVVRLGRCEEIGKLNPSSEDLSPAMPPAVREGFSLTGPTRHPPPRGCAAVPAIRATATQARR